MGDEEEVVKTTYEYLDGDQESSEWLSRAGKCKVTYPNGDVYEGSFNDLKQRHGNGIPMHRRRLKMATRRNKCYTTTRLGNSSGMTDQQSNNSTMHSTKQKCKGCRRSGMHRMDVARLQPQDNTRYATHLQHFGFALSMCFVFYMSSLFNTCSFNYPFI